MNRLRFADVKTAIARVLNECVTSPRVLSVANEAHRRLVAKGKWVGTVIDYQICISNSACLVWPRQIETIEAYWICNMPGTVRNGWYSANLNGPGLLDEDSCSCRTLIDRPMTATFDQPDNATSKVQVYSEVPETAGLEILIRGYDENSNWIRTEHGGDWVDGEYVSISTTPNLTVNKFTNITEVIKPVTKGNVRLWQYDTSLNTATKALAFYEPDETVPVYRQSLIPGLQNASGGEDCSQNKVTVRAKLRHIDVRTDNDFFLLGNLAALKLMAMAILKEERNLFDESMAYEAKAIKELNDELGSFEGDGVVATLRTENPATWGGGGIINPIEFGYRIGYR